MSIRACSLAAVLVFISLSLAPSAWASADKSHGVLPNWHAEFKVSPYAPKISQNETKQSHYNLMYGDEEPIMLSFASHYYVWSGFGLLGVGGKIGWWKQTGQARICPSATGGYEPCYGLGTDTIAANSQAGNSVTQLAIMPLSFEVVYRLDYLYRQWGIPFEAYAKMGIDYHLWWATTEGETSETTRTDADGNTKTISGKGGTPGMNASVGLMFNLDWIEPVTSARALKNGMTGSYLFVEWNAIMGDGFKQPNRLDMSASTWTFGLAMDFL